MIAKKHWIGALIIALALHVGAFLLFTGNSTPVQGAMAAGEQGVDIDLGMLGDLGEEKNPEPEAGEPQPEPEVQKEPEPVVEPPEPEPVVEPEPKPVVTPPKQESVAKVKPKPEPKPEPKPKPKPKPEKKVTPKPQPAATEKSAEPSDSAKKSGAGGSAESAKKKATTGTGNSASNGGNKAAKRTYYSELAAKLARYKRYPMASRRRGEEGVVKLFFVINRDGKVLNYKIAESSGSKRLDRAVISMLENAQPLPAFPADLTQQQLSITIPIEFSINDR